MLKKVSIVSLFAFALCCFIVNPVLAQEPFVDVGKANKGWVKGPSGPAGKSNIGHLYLHEKDADWNIVEDGAWGKMRYNLSGDLFDFVFNGHQLETGLTYALIYYPDPWPGNGLICLGVGMADEYGDVHIRGKVDTVSLPIESDVNEGAKIWLVLQSDVDCEGQVMTGWNPTQYLFEFDTITFMYMGEEIELEENDE
jgi:hypothetical protein